MTESVDYKIVKSFGPVEIRKYPQMVLATVASPYDDAAFSILFRYIAGNNEPNERISMTAPVISQRTRGERIEMTAPVISDEASFSFVLPPTFNMSNAPRPKDSRIRILGVPSRYVATIRFSGRAYMRDVVTMENELRKELKDNNIRKKGAPFLMRYNSPFTPGFMRHNEVGIEVLAEDVEREMK